MTLVCEILTTITSYNIIFQRLSDRLEYRIEKLEDDNRDFKNVDRILSTFGFTEDKKMLIYQLLSAVLHLGNIQFEGGVEAQIKKSTNHVVDSAANLLKVSSDELKAVLLYNLIPDAGSEIR